jgi:hypothetical protein
MRVRPGSVTSQPIVTQIVTHRAASACRLLGCRVSQKGQNAAAVGALRHHRLVNTTGGRNDIPQPPNESPQEPAAPPLDAPAAAAKRQWWKKKRFLIPAGGLVAIAAIAGQGGDDSANVGAPVAAPSSTSSVATTTTSITPTSVVAAPVTEEPTPTEEAVSYAGEYDEAFGTFKAFTKSGRGDSVVKFPSEIQGGILVATHKGSSNFIVHALDSGNQDVDGLVNEIGRYSGTVMIGESSDEAAAKLKIEADGAWTITLKPVSQAPLWKAKMAGKGDGVFLYEMPAADLAFTHKGDSNFIVHAIGNGDGGLINEIGAYKGTVPVSDGPAVITIRADGSWTAISQ